MRIAYLIINYNRREGTSKAVAEVASRLARSHDVHLYARSAEGWEKDGVHWHRIPGPRYPHIVEFLGYTLPTELLVPKRRFDVIHAAGAVYRGAHLYTIQNVQPAKQRILQEIQRDEKVSPARRWCRVAYLVCTSRYEKICYRSQNSSRSPHFLPVSTGVRRELMDHYAVDLSDTTIIPNAADIDVFRPVSAEERQIWRRREGIGDENIVFAFTGGEWRRKGLDLALEGFRLAGVPNAKLLVLGRDPAQSQFEELANTLGIREKIVFAGYRSDVPQVLGAADAFLFPSRYEAFSLATIEAAACGLPVIATRINGAEDFISDGRNGMFVEFNPRSIANAICSLAGDSGKRQQMGRVARADVENRFTWDHVASATEAIYERVLHCTRLN